jgi:hypothetical protein
MSVIWKQKCGCNIEDYGYGREPSFEYCIFHTAGAKLFPLCQALVEAHDNELEPLEVTLDRIIPKMRHIFDAYKRNVIWELWKEPS